MSQTSSPRVQRSSLSIACVRSHSKRIGIAPAIYRHHYITLWSQGRQWEETSSGQVSPASQRPRPAPAKAPPPPVKAPRVNVAAPASSQQPGTPRNDLCSDAARSVPAMDRKVAREFRHKVRAARGSPSAWEPSLYQSSLSF